MTDRGGATLKVYRGAAAIAATEPVEGYVEYFEEYAEMEDAGQFDLDGVNWFNAAALEAAVPDAVWEVFLSPYCEESSRYYAYHPEMGVVQGSHLDHEIVVTLAVLHASNRGVRNAARIYVDELTKMDSLLQALAGPSGNRISQQE
jgi:hypothetical protein